MTKPFQIAIDGPAASGKGTLARRLAQELGFAHLDTGKLYRAVAAKMLQSGQDPADEAAGVRMAASLKETILNENLADPALMADEVGQAASQVASLPGVRFELKMLQQNFAAEQKPGVVMDGRDIGTVICPQADVKFFIVADVGVRAQRRYKELERTGVSYEAVLADMKARDARDTERATAPLKAAEDALVIDTSELDAEQAYAKVRTIVRDRLKI